MIDMEKLVNYEENKEDPNWNAVLRKLQESQGMFKIGKLIVHPGAQIEVPIFIPSEKRGNTIIDLDVLELVSGVMLVLTKTRLNGGHLAYSEADTSVGKKYSFQCKSEKPVCDEHKGFVLKQNSELITYDIATDGIAVDLGNNSRLIIYTSLNWWRGTRDPSSFKIGDNSQVDFNIDFYEEFHIDIGNNCKVLRPSKYNHTKITGMTAEPGSGIVQIKKMRCKRPIKIKDNTVCLLAN